MKLTYDPDKRAKTLAERRLDFEDAVQVFAGTTFTIEDDRWDYGEQRFQTMGFLGDRLVMVVWTPRDPETRQIISMRKCNEREKEKYGRELGS